MRQDRVARARALEVASILDMNLGAPDRSWERASEALEIYTRLGAADGVARIMDARAMATFLDGRITEAIAGFRTVSQLFTDSGDLLRVVTPQSTLGHALVFNSKAEAGLDSIEAALELARSLGDREGQSYALWHRSEALAALGDATGALASARESLAIAELIRHRGWTATALRGCGIAHACAGDLDAARAAFSRSLDMSAGLPLFRSWAASRLAIVDVRRGHDVAAGPMVELELNEGPPLAHYEARLAQAEQAAADAAPDRIRIAQDALALASAGGHIVSVPRLSALASAAPGGTDPAAC